MPITDNFGRTNSTYGDTIDLVNDIVNAWARARSLRDLSIAEGHSPNSSKVQALRGAIIDLRRAIDGLELDLVVAKGRAQAADDDHRLAQVHRIEAVLAGGATASDLTDQHLAFLDGLAGDMECQGHNGDASRIRKIAGEIEDLREEIEDLREYARSYIDDACHTDIWNGTPCKVCPARSDIAEIIDYFVTRNEIEILPDPPSRRCFAWVWRRTRTDP